MNKTLKELTEEINEIIESESLINELSERTSLIKLYEAKITEHQQVIENKELAIKKLQQKINILTKNTLPI